MKKSVEKQIRQAFNKMDEQNTELDFDKAAVWRSINKDKKKNTIPLYWYNAASIVLIMLLSMALANSLKTNKAKEQVNVQMAEENNNTLIKTKLRVDTIFETKIIYKTHIKEVMSSASTQRMEDLNMQYSELKKQYDLLEQENKLLKDYNKDLLADIQSQKEQWNIEKTSYLSTISDLKSMESSPDFSINIDQEALLALAKDEKKNIPEESKKAKQSKINIEYKSKILESTAPILRGFSFK